MSAEGREIIVVKDAGAVAQAAAARLVARIEAQPGRVAICLTGGSTPQKFYELLATKPWRSRVPWERIDWFVGDERCVPQDHPKSNFGMARRAFLDACAPAYALYPIFADGPNGGSGAYEMKLREYYGCATLDSRRVLFDLCLLGIGPDGHTASLFPGNAATLETERWVVDVPEVPVAPFVPRVTLTFPVLASCREMLFLVSGEEKRGIVTRALADDTLPASRARSIGDTVWLMDRAASPEAYHGR